MRLWTGARLLALAIALSPCAFLPASAQAKEAAKVESDAEKRERREKTIRYGIESEILELLKSLGAEKESGLNEELLKLLESSRSPRLRTAILDFFRAVGWDGAEKNALRLVEDRDLEDSGLIGSALSYLAEIRSKKALEFSADLMEENDSKLLPTLIRLLGRAGSQKEEELLLSWLEGDAAKESQKQEAIKALGEIGSEKAAEKLETIVKDTEAPRFDRIYACEALAKIGLESSVESLITAANAEDPNVRTAAIEALGSFKGRKAEAALMEGLRDSFVKARIAACKSIGKKGMTEAVAALSYKAANDPERAVKMESIRALAEIGGEEAFSFLRSLISDKKREAALRSLAFGQLIKKDASGSMSVLVERLGAEAKDKDRSFYTALAREIAASDSGDAAPLARILLEDKDYLIRIGALEWAKKSKAESFRAALKELSEKDASEVVKKRAAEILAGYPANP